MATALAGLVALPAAAFAAATEADMQAMTQAMTFCEFDTTYYTTIENLDDISSPSPSLEFQYINDGGGALVIRPAKGDIEPNRVNLVTAALSWQGPYLSIPSSRFDDENSDYDEGTILDFWGTPYYFYTPLGLVEPKSESISLRYYGDAFDRYTIVSHGPDGLMSEDDVFWQFGSGVTVPTVSAAEFFPTQTRGGQPWTMEVRGYNLGATQGSGAVLIEGSEDPSVIVQSWTPTRIEVEFPNMPLEGALVSVRTDGNVVTRSVAMSNSSVSSVVGDWSMY